MLKTLFLLLALTSVVYSRKCFSCLNVDVDVDCTDEIECEDDSYCYAISYTQTGLTEKYYSKGCAPKTQGEDDDEEDTVICTWFKQILPSFGSCEETFERCMGNLCNGAGAQTAGVAVLLATAFSLLF